MIDLRFESFVARTSDGTPAAAPATATTIYAYPASGQSREQQAHDRRECEADAVSQAGSTSSQTATAPDDANRRQMYLQALATCLTARGYSVQ